VEVLSVVGVLEDEGVRVRRRHVPMVTGRDVVALRWVGEQYGARLDVLGVLLGRLGGGEVLSLRSVRDVVGRWRERGLAEAERLESGVWVSLTRKAQVRAGLGDLRLKKVPWKLERHHHAVNVVRLAYEADRDRAVVAPWVSERLTWHERADAGWHVPDGVIRVEDPRRHGGGRSEAVEVELSRKSRREYRDEVFGNLRRGSHPVELVRYFVESERFRDGLAEDLAAVSGDRKLVRWSVELLPEVPGVSYIKKW
jgi:hypothetical protein